MARVLCPLDEPLADGGGRMAGLQVRVYELASALARAGHDVRVAVPSPAPVAPAPFRTIAMDALGDPVDVWITHPRMVAPLAPRVRARALVVDGYESPFGSFLSHAAALVGRVGERAVDDYRATAVAFLGAFARADRVLCANESQRVSYLTALAMLGRITPRTPAPDLVLQVSSGASGVPPPRLRDATPHDPVLLWCGGCYPWFDVETYLAALPAIVARVPAVRLRFAGIDGVGDGGLPLARRIREVVAATPALASRAEFVPWRPYAERGALYAEADVGVCTYGAHLETRLSMRTRVIDMIWGGLPLVVSAGDDLSGVVAGQGLGRAVPPGDATALAEAVCALLDDPGARSQASQRAAALARGELSWDHQVAPLAAYCAAVASGASRPSRAVGDAEALVRLNDGWLRHGRDLGRRIGRRLARAWRGVRSERGGAPVGRRASA